MVAVVLGFEAARVEDTINPGGEQPRFGTIRHFSQN